MIKPFITHEFIDFGLKIINPMNIIFNSCIQNDQNDDFVRHWLPVTNLLTSPNGGLKELMLARRLAHGQKE